MDRAKVGIIHIFPKLHVSIFALFTVFFFIISQGVVYSGIFLSAVLIHELAHIFFLRKYHVLLQHITIYPFGVDIVCDTGHLSYKKEFIIAVSGSFANLAYAFIGNVVMFFYPSQLLLFFVLCNVFLGIFNLIPLPFFDGGRALRLLLYDRLDINTAFYISKCTDIISAFIFLLLSFLLLDFSNFNFSISATIIYAALSCLATNTFLHTKTP